VLARVVAESAAKGRFEALHGARVTPLVGREEEINLLLARWEEARDGAGQVVLLSGEPGIGKSRTALGLLEALLGEAHIRLRYQCSPFHSRSALHPVLEQMARAAGIEDTDPADLKLAKLETVLAMGTEQVEEAILLLAPLLSIPTGGRGPPPQLSPERRRQRTGEILLEQLKGLAARQPLLMIFEDAQWIDPSTSELLGLAIERIHKLPVLLLVTFRSEFASPWRGRSVTALSLAGLSRRQILAMVDWITDAKSLPAEVLEQTVERTDGVPLFIEELTKAVLESGLLVAAGDSYELAGPLPPVGIPATLRDSLMARLDRWASVKEVAQIGAAINREFSHALLAAVADRPEPELQAALDQLVSSELVFCRGTPPEASYSFKHALVQDAAYGTLPKSRRQLLHAKIAQTVELRYPEIGEFRPEWLAHHYMEGGLVDRAAERWLAAGQRAKHAYANREAAWHLQRCLDAVDTWSARIGDQSLEQLALRALVMLGDLASLARDLEEANRRYEQALALPCALESRTSIENKQHRYRCVLRNGARIAFYEHGSGPRTLLFVAPLGYEPAAFQPIAERLCQDFRIVTIEAQTAVMIHLPTAT
jgi:predicted ATPase